MLSAFAYLDIAHPVVAWNAYRGVLVSALADTAVEGCPVSLMLTGILSSQNAVRFQNEIAVESVRQQRYPHLPSRLSAMYFFEDLVAAERAWNWGEHFKKSCLAELELYPTTAVATLDANWISFAPRDANGIIIRETLNKSTNP